MPVAPPTSDTRWRCAACGNLTRFDVVRTRRLREYVHADLAGAPVVEESETLSDVVEHVTCRWCGAVDQVELVARPAADGATPAGAPAAVFTSPDPAVSSAAPAASAVPGAPFSSSSAAAVPAPPDAALPEDVPAPAAPQAEPAP